MRFPAGSCHPAASHPCLLSETLAGPQVVPHRRFCAGFRSRRAHRFQACGPAAPSRGAGRAGQDGRSDQEARHDHFAADRPGRQRAAVARPAGAAHRHAAGPAGAAGEGVQRAAGPGAPARPRAHRGGTGRLRPRRAGRGVQRAAGAAPLPPGHGGPDPGPGPAHRGPLRRRRGAAVASARPPARSWSGGSPSCPASARPRRRSSRRCWASSSGSGRPAGGRPPARSARKAPGSRSRTSPTTTRWPRSAPTSNGARRPPRRPAGS